MGWYRKNNVAGASNNRNRCNNVAGEFDTNFKVPVNAYIEGEDFCRAVNRCLVNQLLAAEEDNNNGHGDHCNCSCCRH